NQMGNTDAQGGNWYFYSPASISTGRAEFVRRWGNRPLQDNWRRNKNLVSGQTNTLAQNQNLEEEHQESEVSKEEQKLVYRQEFLHQIPCSDAARATAQRSIEEAYYTLGNIYNFSMEEPQNAH